MALNTFSLWYSCCKRLARRLSSDYLPWPRCKHQSAINDVFSHAYYSSWLDIILTH